MSQRNETRSDTAELLAEAVEELGGFDRLNVAALRGIYESLQTGTAISGEIRSRITEAWRMAQAPIEETDAYDMLRLTWGDDFERLADQTGRCEWSA